MLFTILQAAVQYDSTQAHDAIELSRTIRDLGALTVMAGVFLILVLIMFAYFIYQLVNQQKQLKLIAESSERVLEYIKDQRKRVITSDQAELITNMVCKLDKQNTVLQIVKIIRENNIDNREQVSNKIQNYVDLAFSKTHNTLSKFELGNHNLCQLLESSWKAEISKAMDEDTRDKSYDIYKLEEKYTTIFGRFETILMSKIGLEHANN